MLHYQHALSYLSITKLSIIIIIHVCAHIHVSYLLIVVEHSVHVLDPDGVDGPVKDEPLAVGRLGGGKGSVADGQDPVRPLVGDGVKGAVQLAHGDGLGVQHCD